MCLSSTQTSAAHRHTACLIRSAALSATATTAKTGCPETMSGKTDASTTRSPLTPWTRSLISTALFAASLPMRTEDVYVEMVLLTTPTARQAQDLQDVTQTQNVL